MAFPTWQTFGSVTGNTAGTSATVPKPSGTVQGDLMVAFITKSNTPDFTVVPTGWTLIRNTAAAADVRHGVWWKIAGASEPADYTWQWAASVRYVGSIHRITVHHATTPVEGSGTPAVGVSGTPDPPSYTPGSTQDYLILVSFGEAAKGNSATPPTNYTERSDLSTSGAGPNNAHAASSVATRQLNTGAAENPGTFTSATSEDWVANTVFIQPVAATSFTRTHTTDALKVNRVLKTHTTDAILKGTLTRTHTTDGIKQAQDITVVHTTDAIKQATVLATHTTDAVLIAGGTVTHTTDAIKQTTVTKTHTTDALLVAQFTSQVELGLGTLQDPQTDLDHRVQVRARASAGSGDLDVVLVQGTTVIEDFTQVTLTGSFVTYTFDVTPANAATITNYADLRLRLQGIGNPLTVQVSWIELRTPPPPAGVLNFTTDAILQATGSADHTTDALKVNRLTVDHTTDAILQATQVRSHQTHAIVVSRVALAHTTDAVLQTTVQVSHTTDAIKRATQTRTHTTDALLSAASMVTHTTDAIKKDTIEATHTTDARVVDRQTLTHTTDALLQVTVETTHTTDAVVVSRQVLTHTTDAVLQTTVETTHTTDARVVSRSTLTHTTDALLLGAKVATHTTDALLESAGFVTHTTDAIKKAEGVQTSHTTDAIKKAENVQRTHTTDAVLSVLVEVSHTTDALLQAPIEITHTTDAILRGTSQQSHTTDAILEAAGMVTHTTDAILQTTAQQSHTTDAFLQAVNAVTHTTDAIVGVSLLTPISTLIGDEFNTIVVGKQPKPLTGKRSRTLIGDEF